LPNIAPAGFLGDNKRSFCNTLIFQKISKTSKVGTINASFRAWIAAAVWQSDPPLMETKS
jgi:hypothetical protein